MIEWPELESLVEELRAANENRWKETEALKRQFDQLQFQLQAVVQQFALLQVHDALRALNERLLGGMGWIEMFESGAGVEHSAALVWPAMLSPFSAGEIRSADEAPARSAMHRIDVWLGLDPQDAQPRIRIAGAKRLEAKLPTSVERFRGALLSVFRSPRILEPTLGPEEPGSQRPEVSPSSEAPLNDAAPPEEGAEQASESACGEAAASAAASEQAIPMDPAI